jgi:FdhE protein
VPAKTRNQRGACGSDLTHNPDWCGALCSPARRLLLPGDTAEFPRHKDSALPTPIISDGSMERVISAPRVVLPSSATLFADRAARFLQLAAGHPMADYLALMGAVAQAQHETLGKRSAPAVPATALEQSRDYGMPPLAALSHARDPQWRADLSELASLVASRPTAKVMVDAVRALDDAALESLADRVLGGTTLDADAAAVPLVGAALQVYFARLAATIDADLVKNFDVVTVCPVCATRPVASVVRLGGDRNNLRYLVCALCSSEWHLTRIQCSACEDEKGVHYLSLTSGDAEPSVTEVGAAAARRAEACDECKSYLKIFYQEKDPQLDPVADDLASLALDVLVDERGYGRSGPNLLFHPGSA